MSQLKDSYATKIEMCEKGIQEKLSLKIDKGVFDGLSLEFHQFKHEHNSNNER